MQVRHPNILSYLHSTETEAFDGSSTKITIYIVTEPVMPLSEKIKELKLEGTQRYMYYLLGVSIVLRCFLLTFAIAVLCKMYLEGCFAPSNIFSMHASFLRSCDWSLPSLRYSPVTSSLLLNLLIDCLKDKIVIATAW